MYAKEFQKSDAVLKKQQAGGGSGVPFTTTNSLIRMRTEMYARIYVYARIAM